MNIQSTGYNSNQNINFTARIKIRNKAGLLEHLTTEVLPEFSKKNKRTPVEVFMPDFLFNKKKQEFLNVQAEFSGYGAEWFKKNAENHGINAELSNYGDIYIFTGDDVASFRKAVQPDNFRDDILLEDALEFALTKPQHLRPFALISKRLEHYQKLFDDFLSAKNFKHVENLSELKKELSQK